MAEQRTQKGPPRGAPLAVLFVRIPVDLMPDIDRSLNRLETV
jgi:hypothetical protein